MLHVDLNVSILLREYPFAERFDQAARLGFDAVEFWWPAGEDLRAIAKRIRDAGPQVISVNFDHGNMAAGERGLLNYAAGERRFRSNVPVAVEFAMQVGCRNLNVIAGTWRDDEGRAAQLERVRENLRLAAEAARPAGITVVVEALNSFDAGDFIFTNTRDTLAVLESVGAPNLKYLYDAYHLQRMEGNIVDTIRRYVDRIGHIQIADSPGRNQPGTGELCYRYVLQEIEAAGYTGSIGLEYQPLGSTEESLAWLPVDQRRWLDPAKLQV
ncbi:MAG: TIM barrel protein [Gemmataceae bacterium]|nr:TIM barrel protein [Gemmataceae bacterium]